MLNFHGIWACFLFDIKKLLRSSRFYMTILVVCFVIWDHLAPISTWLAAQHYKITPWVYPFISNSVFLQMVIVGGTLFLFSDAPFFDETQLLLMVHGSNDLYLCFYDDLFCGDSVCFNFSIHS